MATVGVGAAAPALSMTLEDADGMPHRLGGELASGPLLLGIYKSSCQASKTAFPYLQRLADRYGASGLTVYGVAQDSANITRSFARRLDLTMPILIEGPDYPVTMAFEVVATPTVFLIGTDGKVAWSSMGFMKPQMDELATAVADQLGEPPRPLITEADADVPMFVPG